MRWLKTALVLALAAGIAPATAGPARGVTAEQRAAWLDLRARLVAGLPGAPEHRQLDDLDFSADVVDAGDLDGDGAGDLVDVRSHLMYDDTLGVLVERVRLEAFRGRDGTALWTREVPPGQFVVPIASKVGVTGERGVVVLTFVEESAGAVAAGAGRYDVVVTAIGSAGVPLWTQVLTGAWTDTPVAYTDSWSGIDGFLDAVTGPATDLVVTTVGLAEAFDPTGSVYEGRTAAQVSLLDGATGVLRPLGTPTADRWAWVDAAPAGDLDGDRLDDVVANVQTESETSVRAFSSVTGSTLWTLPDPAKGGGLGTPLALPDVTGDGVEDLSIETASFGGIVVIGGRATARSTAPLPPGRRSQVLLVDGARGKVVWRKTGDRMLVLGNADRKAGAEVAVGSYVESSKAFGFTVTAYTAAGKRLWSATRTLRMGKGDSPQMNSYSAFADTGSDGVTEIGYGVVVRGKRVRRDEGVIDGRTGRVRKDPRPGMWATRSAFDGRGADGYLATTHRSSVRVEAWAGDAPRRLWSTTVAANATMYYGSFATSVDGDKCGDMVTAVWGPDNTYTDVVFSGSTGKVLWVLRRTDDEPGVVAKATLRSYKLYKRGC